MTLRHSLAAALPFRDCEIVLDVRKTLFSDVLLNTMSPIEQVKFFFCRF